MNELREILINENCSLVVKDIHGNITTYNKKGVRDLIWLLDNEPERLKGAQIADKIVGKASAGLLINAQVSSIFAEVISEKAIDLLKKTQIPFQYAIKTERIIIPEGEQRCRLEEIVEDAKNANQVEQMLRKHFKN